MTSCQSSGLTLRTFAKGSVTFTSVGNNACKLEVSNTTRLGLYQEGTLRISSSLPLSPKKDGNSFMVDALLDFDFKETLSPYLDSMSKRTCFSSRSVCVMDAFPLFSLVLLALRTSSHRFFTHVSSVSSRNCLVLPCCFPLLLLVWSQELQLFGSQVVSFLKFVFFLLVTFCGSLIMFPSLETRSLNPRGKCPISVKVCWWPSIDPFDSFVFLAELECPRSFSEIFLVVLFLA